MSTEEHPLLREEMTLDNIIRDRMLEQARVEETRERERSASNRGQGGGPWQGTRHARPAPNTPQCVNRVNLRDPGHPMLRAQLREAFPDEAPCAHQGHKFNVHHTNGACNLQAWRHRRFHAPRPVRERAIVSTPRMAGVAPTLVQQGPVFNAHGTTTNVFIADASALAQLRQAFQ
eukprot:1143580-Pelagomonas_calceolata.AAC.2